MRGSLVTGASVHVEVLAQLVSVAFVVLVSFFFLAAGRRTGAEPTGSLWNLTPVASRLCFIGTILQRCQFCKDAVPQWNSCECIRFV